MRYSCGHVSTKKNVRGIKDAATSTPPQLRSSRYIRYRDNIGYPRYGERYDIGDNQYSSNNLSYCPINRFLESVPTLTRAPPRDGLGVTYLPSTISSDAGYAECAECVFYYCRTYYKAVRVGGGGEWRTCAMRDDEPRPVWMSLPITH